VWAVTFWTKSTEILFASHRRDLVEAASIKGRSPRWSNGTNALTQHWIWLQSYLMKSAATDALPDATGNAPVAQNKAQDEAELSNTI
jgi:hypothetical protein